MCRNKFKEIFKMIVTDTEENTQKFIKDFKTHFKSLPPEAVAFPRGVTKLAEFSDRKTIYKKLHQFMYVVLYYIIKQSKTVV